MIINLQMRAYLEVCLYVICKQRVVLVLGVHERVAARDESRRVRGQLAELVLKDLRNSTCV